jgi:hypothetical protein
MDASASGASLLPHFSQAVLISRAIKIYPAVEKEQTGLTGWTG